MRPAREIGVVVPAHDEEDRIGACIERLQAAKPDLILPSLQGLPEALRSWARG